MSGYGVRSGISEGLRRRGAQGPDRAPKKIAEQPARAVAAAERADTAKDRLERLERGESVSGGLGKRLDFDKLLEMAGITPSEARDMMQIGSPAEEEFKGLLRLPSVVEVTDKATRRAVRPSYGRGNDE